MGLSAEKCPKLFIGSRLGGAVPKCNACKRQESSSWLGWKRRQGARSGNSLINKAKFGVELGEVNRILASDFPESHKHKKLISQRTVRAILDSRIPTKSSQWAASNGGFYIFVGSKPVPGWQFSIDRPSWWKTSNLRVIRIFHHEDVFKSENWVNTAERS